MQFDQKNPRMQKSARTERPRVLMVTRLFSGLIPSVHDRKWHPTGIPAIAELIEGLVRRGVDLDVVWCAMTEQEGAVVTQRLLLTFPDSPVAGARFHVLPFSPLHVSSTKVRAITNGLPQWMSCVQLLRRQRPDVVYVDRSHVVFGATAQRIFSTPTFLRFLGVYPDQKALLTTWKEQLRFPLVYLAHTAPFSGIVCTQDDSGGGYYVDQIPNRTSPRHLMVNGVDHDAPTVEDRKALRVELGLREDRRTLIFVGKMELIKGCLDFVEICGVLKDRGVDVDALMLGTGPAESDVRRRIEELGLVSRVHFLGPVDNALIGHYYGASDIYVHLYRWASLTNTMLEAIRAGCAIVMLESDPEIHVGEFTDRFLPHDGVRRVSRDQVIAGSADAVGELISDADRLVRRRITLSNFADTKLKTRLDRIDQEIDFLLEAIPESL
jgi:glycosyltransferase involved in cell wall biosynthesis